MSATMTGPARSPSSGWSREPPTCQPLGSPMQTSTLSRCDSYFSAQGDSIRSQNLTPERSSPGYFGASGNQLNLKQGRHIKDWEHFSNPQSQVPSPQLHIISQKPLYGDYADWPRDASESDKESRDYVSPSLPLRRQVQRSESSPEGYVPRQSPLKSPQPQYLRNHRMSVLWAENSSQNEQTGGNVLFSKSPCTPIQNPLHQLYSPPPQHLQGAEQDPRPYLACPVPHALSSTLVHKNTNGNSPTPNSTDGSGSLASVERCGELLQSFKDEVMLLDVRPYAHFAQANIRGSLNLCIPTTLLKRRSFNTQKLEATFTDETEKRSFAKWRHCRFIIVYDAVTADMKDAAPLLNVLKKFVVEGWGGEGLILGGGFKAFSDAYPSLIRSGQSPETGPSLNQSASLSGDGPSVAPVVGGCTLPESSTAAVPFFGNIRQNTDLIGGVGQIPPQLPEQLTESKRRMLPAWLRVASDPKDEGHQVSAKFLDLEKRELDRMKEALSYDRSAESSSNRSSKSFQIAGIEKGNKNRYNDIYPFDHSRVRLQGVMAGGCDYVNANHVKAEYASRRYIATQAPIPDTFNVSLCVSLTMNWFILQLP